GTACWQPRGSRRRASPHAWTAPEWARTDRPRRALTWACTPTTHPDCRMTTRADQIRHALSSLRPLHLDVIDESHMHSRGLETHYKAVIVSEAFEGRRPIQRHQAVYAAM